MVVQGMPAHCLGWSEVDAFKDWTSWAFITMLPLTQWFALLDFRVKQGVRLVTHPPYSLNLSHSDFFLFSEVKKQLCGCWFNDADEAIKAYEEGIMALIRYGKHPLEADS